MAPRTILLTSLLGLFLPIAISAQPVSSKTNLLRNVDIALQAKEDFWGQIAMHQPGGPSYEFFALLLPPLRYVDAAFRYYPIVLSAPGSQLKARLVSNGCAI